MRILENVVQFCRAGFSSRQLEPASSWFFRIPAVTTNTSQGDPEEDDVEERIASRAAHGEAETFALAVGGPNLSSHD